MKCTLDIRAFIVKNVNTGKEYEFKTLDQAENYLNGTWVNSPDEYFVLYAEVEG